MPIAKVNKGDVLTAASWNLMVDEFNQRAGTLTIKDSTILVGTKAAIHFGKQTRQMINLWGTGHGIGVQSYTHYYRTTDNFAWYSKGVHDDKAFSPGAGGRRLMGINNSGDLILSSRTNPSGDPKKSLCRALVDYTNKLYINWGNDFAQGVFVDGNSNIISLVGKDHAYVEFYPKGIDRKASNPRAKRWAWMGYGNKAAKDFTISNAQGKINLKQASDFYLKEDIADAAGVLDKVMKMRPVYFKYKTDEKGSPKHLGIIAQEIEKIFPELVSTSAKNTLTVDYQPFAMLAIQAIRELKTEVDQLKQALNYK